MYSIIIIYFLLISGHTILINGSVFIELIEDEIAHYSYKGLSNSTGSKKHNLKLSDGGRLGGASNSLVWKGIYNDDVNVAIKIIWSENVFNEELAILKALNAINNPKIEEHGIPNVHYHGQIFHTYFAIAMTLFTETLMDVHDRYEAQGKHLSELSILLMFKEAMETLKYFNTMKVVHNDIKPANLFRRGANIFIGDFDLATLNGRQNKGHSIAFASSNFFAGKNRSPNDDLESLVFSMWYVAGMPSESSNALAFSMWNIAGGSGESSNSLIPEGFVLFQSKANGTAKAKMKERCQHFKDENVRKVFELVAADEMLKTDGKVPNFKRITTTINNAIDKSFANMKPSHSEWIKRATSIEHSLIGRK